MGKQAHRITILGTSGLLLAAGFGRRFGTDKRLHVLPGSAANADGEELPLALVTVKRWCAALLSPAPDIQGQHSPLAHLYVVTRPNDALADLLSIWLAEQQQTGCTLLVAEDADLGMGHSVARSAELIPAGPLLIGLADMPYVTTSTITALSNALQQGSSNLIVQPRFAGKPGNPVGFGAAQRDRLCRLTGDQGARTMIAAAKRDGSHNYLSVNDPGIHQDIDTPADLACNSPRHN